MFAIKMTAIIVILGAIAKETLRHIIFFSITVTIYVYIYIYLYESGICRHDDLKITFPSA